MKIIEERIPWFHTPSFQPNGWITKQFPPPTKWPNKNHRRNGRKIRRMGTHQRDFSPGFCRRCLSSNFGCFFGHTLSGYTWHFFPSKESSPQQTYKKTQEIQIFQIYIYFTLYIKSLGICNRWGFNERDLIAKEVSKISVISSCSTKNPCHGQLLPKKTLPGRKRHGYLIRRREWRTLIWV